MAVIKDNWEIGDEFAHTDANEVAAQVNANTEAIANVPALAAASLGVRDDDGEIQFTWGGSDFGDPIPVVGGTWSSTVGAPSKLAVGVEGDGTTDDRGALASSDDAALAASLPLMLAPGTYKVSSNLTIDSAVWFLPGAVIKPDDGVTVTLAAGVVNTGNRQVFDHSAGGIVVPKNVDFYRPQWWGALADGTTDDSTAWTDMADAIDAGFESIPTDFTEGSYSIGQKVLAPSGVTRMIDVTLDRATLYGSWSDSAFLPPTGTTSGTILTLDPYSNVRGGWFGTDEEGQAVTCIHMKGHRVHIDDVFISNSAASSVGIQAGTQGAGGSTAPVINNVIIRASSIGDDSVGIDLQSSDAQLTNLYIAYVDTGILGTFSAANRWNNIHVWNCNTGIGGGHDSSQMTNIYLDSNYVWGMDINNLDRTCMTNVYAWNNGEDGGGGGIRLTKSSNARHSTLKNVVLVDNIGHGAYIDGVDEFDLDVILNSQSVQGGGELVTTTGVEVTSGTDHLQLQLRGDAATTPLVNASTNTRIGSRPARVVAASNLVKNNTTGYGDAFMTITPILPNRQYLIRGVIIVDGSPDADMKFRIQNTSGTPASGWFSSSGLLATASTVGTAADVQAYTVRDIAASAGSALTNGIVAGIKSAVHFTGYLEAGDGGNQSLDVFVSQASAAEADVTFYAGSWLEVEELPL